jgi:hypothetical protein
MTALTSTRPRQLQFSLKTVLAFVAVVGLALALARQGRQGCRLGYLLVGLAQLEFALASWWQLRKAGAEQTSSGQVAPLIQFGCVLTLPAWLLAVSAPSADQLYQLATSSQPLVVLSGVVIVVGQVAALLTNTASIFYSMRPIDATLRILMLLNLAHPLMLIGSCTALAFQPSH